MNYDEWQDAYDNALKEVERIEALKPGWHEFSQRFIELAKTGFMEFGAVKHTSQYKNRDALPKLIREWKQFSEEDSKHIWGAIKEAECTTINQRMRISNLLLEA
jgi:hypothetical protein